MRRANAEALTVVGSIEARLRGLIQSGELSVGDRLPPERELAASFGVARVSVREAIRTLTSDGYVTVRRGGQAGTFVTNLEVPYRQWLQQMRTRSGELDALLDLRIAVEGHAAALAAERRSQSDLASLRTALEDLSSSVTRAGFRSADSQFHLGIAAASRSARLASAVGQVRGEFFVPTDTLVFEDQVDTSVHGHGEVLDAIAAQAATQARSAMTRHIEESRTHLHRVLLGSTLGAARRPKS